MSERELLELAAKVAGIYDDGEWPRVDDAHGFFLRDWNPLTDDGDALRLAVKLGLDVDCSESNQVTVFSLNQELEPCCEAWCDNRNAAVRRAIVMAAAQIGMVQGRYHTYVEIENRISGAIADDAPEPCVSTDLRDMMAAALVLPDDLSRQTGRVLAGPEPTDGLELIKWWARAKARLRYIEVDALLEARNR